MNEHEISKYNRRQIVLMQKMIHLYGKNQIDIGLFISNIDALIACIESPPIEWTRKLSKWLWNIESIYAWSLDQRVDCSEKDLENLKHYVGEIEKLIMWYEQNCLPPIDDEIEIV